MDFTIQAVFCRGATLELCSSSIYDAPKGIQVFLNGQPVETDGRNVFSLHGLVPDTSYRITVKQGKTQVEQTFRTKPETVLLNVHHFGAQGNGTVEDTAALQAAILACPQGGTVQLPKGDYRTGPLFLKSGISVWLQKGARLLGLNDRARYPILPGMTEASQGEYNLGSWEGNPLDCYASLFTGIELENVDIFGEGVLDGDAQHGDWWQDAKVKRGAWRPYLLYLVRCRHIRVQGITLTNSYCWTVHPYYCSDVQFLDVSIQNSHTSPNTDGIDPESSTDVLILGCCISVGDDCVAIKSGKRYMARYYLAPTRHVEIRNCRMERGHGSVVIGSEASCGVQDVTVSQCVFCGTDRGLRIKTRRGRGKKSLLTGITLENVRMENVLMPFTLNMFYFCDPDGHSPYVQSTAPAPLDEGTPRIGTITVKDVSCTGATASGGFFYGLPEQPVEKIVLERVTVVFASNAAPEVPIMMDHLADTERLGLWAKNIRHLVLKQVYMKNAAGNWPVTENVGQLETEDLQNE